MPVAERQIDAGARRGRDLELRIGREIRAARRMAGLSQHAVGRMVGVSGSEVGRIERGDAPWLTVRDASVVMSAVGLKLWIQAYPIGSPLRDSAHLRLLEDFEKRLPTEVKAIREWPIPGSQDRRALDLVLVGLEPRTGVEAETVLDDLQALEREINLKRRDAQLERVILLVRGSRRNRDIVRSSPALRRAFPAGTRTTLAALAQRRDPGADALVIL